MAVIPKMAKSGSIPICALVAPNMGKTCKMTMARKKILATRRNCSNRFFGMKVIKVYFDVLTLFLT